VRRHLPLSQLDTVRAGHSMLKSFEGVLRDGRVELIEPLPAGIEGKVIVTFVGAEQVNLSERGIDERQAADLRQRLKTFAEDWDRPEMDVYDAI
jgi:hypothetical protein